MATLPHETSPPEPPLSAIIESLLRRAGDRAITVGDLVNCTAERGFGLLMVFLALPMLIPFLPPGSSTIVGPIYAVFAIQMLSGAQCPWVPQRLRKRILSPRAVRILLERGVPLIRRAERLSRPRGLWLSERMMVRLAAVMVLLMGLVLLGPFPFLNTLPALSVMVLGIGLLNSDMVFLLAGFVIGAAALGFLILEAGLLVALIRKLAELLRNP